MRNGKGCTMMELFMTIGTVVIVILFLIITKSIYLVQQAEIIAIERFGRFHRLLHPGIHFIVPFIDSPRTVHWTYFMIEGKLFKRYIRSTYRIDLREAVYDFPKQNVITKDNVTMEISALLYYQIIDPKEALYEIYDLAEGIEKLTQTTLRNVIGSMDLDETLVSRDAINTRLRVILDEASHKWGVKVNRVELQEVNPPVDIRQAMEKQMRAERDRRAVILEAEGMKRSAILTAEGEQEAAVLKANGEAQARIINAQAEAESRLQIVKAEAEALQFIAKALPKESDATQYMIAMQYLKTLPKVVEGKDDKLVVLPYEATGIMGSLSGIKELLKNS
jgi:regulator of protease activity HflC (stomatin/prohibitin superfamily)